MKLRQEALAIVAIFVSATAVVQAQVPPEIAKGLVALGRRVCVQETAQLYGPLHSGPPYSGVSITRDISFGADPKNVVDVFAPEGGSGSRSVLIYVPGGAGDKRSTSGFDIFYDNVALWAVKNGMVGVLMQRRPGETIDDPARDVAKVVQWVQQSIARYKGNPDRVFIWASSAGNRPVGAYVSHAEFYGPTGIGLKGVVFMSAPGVNIPPANRSSGKPDPHLSEFTGD